MHDLTSRERSILDSLVSTYIDTGEPVGSRTLSRLGLGLSPATVRNSMADLEEKGYLFQPHTSAGRVPTDKGYRTFVDLMHDAAGLDEAQRLRVKEMVSRAMRENRVESLIAQVSKVVAEVSHNLGVALLPRFRQGVFRSMEMVRLSESRLLLVMTIQSGLIKTMVMEVESDTDAAQLEETRRIVNERLAGLSVGDILGTVNERLGSAQRGSPKLLRLICDNAPSLFEFTTEHDIHLVGTVNFLLQPEFVNDQRKLAGLYELFEERSQMAAILSERADSDGILITIGEENDSPELKSCSLLTSRYRMGSISGIIGIMGPTRLDYSRMVPLIRYVAGLTEALIEERFEERSHRHE